MNRWNILHIFAPFSAFFTALLLLNKMPNTPLVDNHYQRYFYSPPTFVVFSIILLGFAVLFPLALRENKGNFFFFFIVYPFWFMGAIVTLFASHPYYGAWASWLVFLLATIVQVVLTAILHDFNVGETQD